MKIVLEGIGKNYQVGSDVSVHALRNVTLTLEPGEFVALMGPSGCGKTTLLTIVGLLTRPSQGRYLLDDRDTSTFTRREQAQCRSQRIGFMFQSYNLLPRETALRNVMLPLCFDPAHRAGRKDLARKALDAVGLSHRASHCPTQMSGGEQQRVAIARALISRPQLLLADEPTGNLDSRTGRDILTLIQDVAKAYGASILVATHDRSVAEHAGRIVEMKDGNIVGESGGK